MQKPWKVLSTAALVAALSVSMVLPAFAADGDITDTKTGTVYQASSYNSNTQAYNTLVNSLIEGTTNQFAYSFGGQQFGFDSYNTAVTALLATPGETVAQAKAAAAKTVTPIVTTTLATVSAINPTIAVGGTTGFTFANSDGTAATPTGVVYSVTSANASTAFFNGGVFTATAAGAYTIQATIGTTNLTTTVTVSGQAVGLKLSAASSSATANGKTADVVTANIVDSNGATVTNYTGTFTITGASNSTDANNSYAKYVTSTGGAYIEGGSVNTATSVETFNVVNGTATFNVVVPAGATTPDTITAIWTDPKGNVVNAPLSLTYTAAVGSAFQVKPTSTSVAGGSTINVPINVLDANGAPLSSGTYVVTATLTGSAYFPGNTQTEQFNISNASGSVSVNAPSYATSGSFTLTVTGTASGSSTQLTSGSATFNIATAGTASQLALKVPSTSNVINNSMTADFSHGNTTNIAGTVQDSNTLTTTTGAPSAVNYTVTMGGKTYDSGSVSVSSGTFTVPFGNTKEDVVGTYAVSISANGLTGTSVNVTVTPGTSAAMKISPTIATSVLASSPTQTVSVQLQDAEGNNVPQAGTTISFYYSAGVGTGFALNGGTQYSGSGTQLAVSSNSSGIATATLTLPSGVGDYATVYATSSGLSTVSTGTITEVGAAISNVAIKAGQTTAYAAGSAAGTSGTPMFTIKATDTYGDLANGDVLDITVPKGLFGGSDIHTNITDGTNSATLVANTSNLEYHFVTTGAQVKIYGATAGAVGTYTITVKDISAPIQPSGTATASVSASPVAGFNFFDASNTNLSTSSTGDTFATATTTTLTLMPVDAAGNPVTADATYTVTLPQLSSTTGLEYRATTAGADVTTITIAPGQTSSSVLLINGTGANVTMNDGSVSTTNLDAAYTSGTSNTQLEAAIGAAAFGTSAGSSTITATNYSEVSPTAGGITTSTSSTAITFTVTLLDANSKPLNNQAVYLSNTTGGTATTPGAISASALYTNSAGVATFTYTTPSAGWTSGVTDKFTIQVGGGSATGITLPNEYTVVTVTQ
jgi:hypothetical protein